MAAKGKRPMRALTAGDKIEAIQRVNDGESKASVARDIGVPESTLRGWCKNEDKLRYMSTRHSTPDTDKSSDAEQPPPEKRARYDASPPRANPSDLPPAADFTPQSPELGLDLTAAPPPAPEPARVAPADTEQPIELTKPKSEPRYDRAAPVAEPPRHNDLKTKADATTAASVSMSAISPLTGLSQLSGVQGHLGMSFNDIATNLSLIAQLNPSLSALTSTLAAAGSGAKTLRSIRSPKPSHAAHVPVTSPAAPLNLSDKYKSGKSHHDYERRPKHKDPSPAPVDDALWYWLKTQQAMLDLTAHSATLPASVPSSLSSPQRPSSSPKPVAALSALSSPPVSVGLDLNKNTWFWQYYKQFGGAMPLPDDKMRSASSVPKEKTDNILYSHLTKGKTHEHVPAHSQREEQTTTASPPAGSPVAATPEREPLTDKPESGGRSQSKARTVLDNLLFNNNNVSQWESVADDCCNSENEFDGAVSEALEHGDKFLAWLEACRDPSVTRMHVHQLRALLGNIRTRAQRKQPAALAHDRISRRK